MALSPATPVPADLHLPVSVAVRRSPFVPAEMIYNPAMAQSCVFPGLHRGEAACPWLTADASQDGQDGRFTADRAKEALMTPLLFRIPRLAVGVALLTLVAAAGCAGAQPPATPASGDGPIKPKVNRLVVAYPPWPRRGITPAGGWQDPTASRPGQSMRIS